MRGVRRLFSWIFPEVFINFAFCNNRGNLIQRIRLLRLLKLINDFIVNLKNYNKMANQENKNQLQIQLRPEVADGKYSNLAMIGHGPNEFLIDFIFAAPGMPQAPVVSRVIMSPENAKQLLFALTDNVKKYEAQFGEIKPRNAQNPGIGNN